MYVLRNKQIELNWIYSQAHCIAFTFKASCEQL